VQGRGTWERIVPDQNQAKKLLGRPALVAAAALAVWILIRPWAEPFHRLVAAALLLTAVIERANAALLGFHADVHQP
jgi:hypothetical protein